MGVGVQYEKGGSGRMTGMKERLRKKRKEKKVKEGLERRKERKKMQWWI